MRLFFLFSIILLSSFAGCDVSAQTSKPTAAPGQLKTYLIERDIPGAGKLSATDLKGISQKSCSVLKELGPGITWLQSYVLGNKIFCVYTAENENLLREHAAKGGFPITAISEIVSTISPKTAE